MPILPLPNISLSSPPKVLVTGANGYIAMWVVRLLLEQGYAVRGTVRTKDKAKSLGETFSRYESEGRVEWFVVDDITKENAFDEAVKGVDAIAHMASPLSTATDDPDEYIKPAVNGTLEVLKSALNFGTNVKRIVVTSSCAAVMRTVNLETPDQATVIFDESNWGDEFVETVKKEGKKALGMIKYRASKTLAERAAWDFVKTHKGDITWDLTTLCPPLVIGPALQPLPSPEALGASLARWYDLVFHEKSDEDLKLCYSFVDVRDIALAHVKALQKEEAANERIIISSGVMTWQGTRDVVNAINPKLYTSNILPRGDPSLSDHILFDYNNEKSKQILGMEYTGKEKMVGDTLADFEGRGWVEGKV